MCDTISQHEDTMKLARRIASGHESASRTSELCPAALRRLPAYRAEYQSIKRVLAYSAGTRVIGEYVERLGSGFGFVVGLRMRGPDGCEWDVVNEMADPVQNAANRRAMNDPSRRLYQAR